MEGQYIDRRSFTYGAWMFTTLLTRALTTPLAQLPSLCAVCHAWQGGRICATCVARHASMVPRCAQCGLAVPAWRTGAATDASSTRGRPAAGEEGRADGGPVRCGRCLTSPPPFERTVAAFDHGFPWDRLVARLKFRGDVTLAAPLAEHLRDAFQRSGAPLPDLVLPTPLSTARLARRGYNQAWELARRVAASLGVPAHAQALLRVRETPPQHALDLSARAANVRGAFAVDGARRAAIADRHVAVVDDVMTTGATMAEIARTLRAAGARRVDAWVLTRTPQE